MQVGAMKIIDGLKWGGKVVSMADRRGKTADHPALAQLRAYWEGLRAEGDLPTRAQIDPRGIERALEYAFIAERIAPGVARADRLGSRCGCFARGGHLHASVDTQKRPLMDT